MCGDDEKSIKAFVEAAARRINDQWRVCFRWTAGGVEDVEIVDYH